MWLGKVALFCEIRHHVAYGGRAEWVVPRDDARSHWLACFDIVLHDSVQNFKMSRGKSSPRPHECQ